MFHIFFHFITLSHKNEVKFYSVYFACGKVTIAYRSSIWRIQFDACLLIERNMSRVHYIKLNYSSQSNPKLSSNKTARIRAKPWKFRLPFKVYGALIR